MRFKRLEHFPQETVREQHPARPYPYGHDIVLRGNSFYAAAVSVVAYQRAFCRRVHRVEQPHRYVGMLGRLHTHRMQNLSPEIRQFGCLFEIQLLDRFCPFHIARVVVVHPVNVCPYFNLFRTYGSTYKRSRIVAPSTLQIVNFPICVPAYISLRNI